MTIFCLQGKKTSRITFVTFTGKEELSSFYLLLHWDRISAAFYNCFYLSAAKATDFILFSLQKGLTTVSNALGMVDKLLIIAVMEIFLIN